MDAAVVFEDKATLVLLFKAYTSEASRVATCVAP
jgi:hypothetical protein